jgi:hypothetical protein
MAQGGNGIDLGTVYQLLSEVAQTARGHSSRLDTIDHRLDDLTVGLADLRNAVTNYHSTVPVTAF